MYHVSKELVEKLSNNCWRTSHINYQKRKYKTCSQILKLKIQTSADWLGPMNSTPLLTSKKRNLSFTFAKAENWTHILQCWKYQGFSFWTTWSCREKDIDWGSDSVLRQVEEATNQEHMDIFFGCPIFFHLKMGKV